MSGSPIICFGQQPCGIFPRRFLYAKIVTARRLQAELGGEIVFFYHDSDHDPRETQTILRHRKTGEPATLNFDFANKIQRRWTPLYAKRVLPEWQAKMKRQLGAYVDSRWVEAFAAAQASNVAEFCLQMYAAMGLLDGIRVARSSDPALRRAACEVDDYFVDLSFEGELVRARRSGDEFQLHEGGDRFITVPAAPYGKEQVSPTRDTRLRWMQSVLGCTHYIAGAGEQAYLNQADAPDVAFVTRDTIDRSDEAYVG
jgi:hypothetical protein